MNDGQTFDVGYVHIVTEHGGPCAVNCPHPDHVTADRYRTWCPDVYCGCGLPAAPPTASGT